MSSSELAVKIRQLLGPDSAIDDKKLSLIESYLRLLAHWNRRVNLTSLPLDGFPEITLRKLIVEPLGALESMPKGESSWFDFGSGGGSPAVPIKVALPRSRLWMVESRGRKAAFLREVVRQLQLSGAEVLSRRIEELAPIRDPGSVDVITVRAVRLTPEVLWEVARLLRPSGVLVLFSRAGLEPGSLGPAFLERSRTADTVEFIRT